MALRRQPVLARVPAAGNDQAGARPFLAEQDAFAPAAGGARGAVFAWMLRRLAEHGLLQGDRIGVDASTLEANAALRAIVRRDSGEGYREMLKRLAAESGIETPTVDDLIRLDR